MIDVGVPLEVEVVEGAGDASEEEQGRGGDHRQPGPALVHEAHPREDEGEGGGGEDLEEALDPEVDDPPAPVLHDGEVGPRREEEAGAVHRGTAIRVASSSLLNLG